MSAEVASLAEEAIDILDNTFLAPVRAGIDPNVGPTKLIEHLNRLGGPTPTLHKEMVPHLYAHQGVQTQRHARRLLEETAAGQDTSLSRAWRDETGQTWEDLVSYLAREFPAVSILRFCVQELALLYAWSLLEVVSRRRSRRG